MLNYIYIGAASLLLLVGTNTATYYMANSIGFEQGEASVKTKLLEASISDLKNHTIALTEQQKAFNEGVAKLNKDLADHSQTVKIIQTNTEKEIEKPVYIDICIPSSGVQLITDSARTFNTKRVP